MTEKEQMLISILNCRRVDLYANKLQLSSGQERDLYQMLFRRKCGEPLQYILGSSDFMGLELHVDQHTLIPRPETELLVETAIENVQSDHLNSPKILELGTGSGNIAIALAKFIPGSFVTTVDISRDALDVAKLNVQRHKVEDQVELVKADMIEFLKKASQENCDFDIIISNPPYVPSSQIETLSVEVQKEPWVALDGGADGLFFYRQMLKYVSLALKEKGKAFFEIGDGQRVAIEKILRSDPAWDSIQFIKDYTRIDRIAVMQKKSRDLTLGQLN